VAGVGGIAVGRNAFSESEEELESESTLDVDKVPQTWNERNPRLGSGLVGWPGLLIGIGLGIAIAAGGVRLFSRPATKFLVGAQQSKSQSLGQSVTVAPVETTLITHTINVTGTVSARDDLIPILPQTTGLQIKQVLVKEGEVVQAGQVMAVLDKSVLQTQIDQAQAQLQSAQAVVGQRQAARAQAQATLNEAQQELRRYQILANQGAISRQDLDTRATSVATDQQAVRVAEANINGAQADVRNNLAKVEQLRTQLAQTVVRAPVNGVVAEKIARIGDVTSGTQKLFSIIRNGLLEVDAQVPATQLPQVRINSRALITSTTDSRIRLQGRVREIAPLVDPQSRQAKVKIDIPPTQLLRPGLFVQAAITTNTTTGLTIPAQSVVTPSTGIPVVFLSGKGIVRAQSVKVGEIVKGDQVEVKQGLGVGDRVVVAGAGYLKDGDRVHVMTQPRVKPTSGSQ